MSGNTRVVVLRQARATLSCHVNLDGDVPAMSLVEGWQPDEASLRMCTHRHAFVLPAHMVL